MKPFFDSSAFAKRYLDEPGSDTVEKICAEASEIHASVLIESEVASAIARKSLEKRITRSEYTTALTLLAAEVNAMRKVPIDRKILNHVKQLVLSHAIKTLDAIHLASAISLKSQFFITSDKRQAAVAKKLGLKVRLV